MCKTPGLLIRMRKYVCNSLSHAMEFEWVSIWSHSLKFLSKNPLCNGCEKGRLQHSKFSIKICMGKTPPLLMGDGKVVCNIWCYALEFGWIRLTLVMGMKQGIMKFICYIWSHALEFVWVSPPPLLLGMSKNVCDNRRHASLGR